MMLRPPKSRLLLVATVMFATGCGSPIRILNLANGPSNNPIPFATVHFDNGFNSAEAWQVSLGSVPLSGFSPAAAKNVTSTVPLVFTHSVPSYTLKATATCGTFCAYTPHEVTFQPPRLVYNATIFPGPTPVPLVQFTTVPVFVGVQFAPTVPIQVTVRESSPVFPRVRLGLSASSLNAPGTALTVTIPAGTTRGDFFIQGQTLGAFQFEFTAVGVVPSTGVGSIVAP